MTENKEFICVNCGAAASALYRTYGPSVLKLMKCDNCKGVVDKYIEYDPVIVMIDLVLMSREAQRHIIYNTEFKSYWKLLIILIMLETYAVWRNDSLFNIAVNTICDIKTNSTDNCTHIVPPLNLNLPEHWRSDCEGWLQADKDVSDLFIWEKDFYVQFISTFAGIVMFISTMHIMMTLFSTTNKGTVAMLPLSRVLRSFTLGGAHGALWLPALLWGAANCTRHHHYLLVFGYGLLVFYNVIRVLYEGPRTLTVLVLVFSNCAKYITMFHVTSLLRTIIK